MSSHGWVAAQLLVVIFLGGCALVRTPTSVSTSAEQNAADTSAAATTQEYRLGAGDVLSIRVYDWRAGTTPNEEDLRIDRLRLDHAGIVSLPFGEFKAAGRTVKELGASIIESLKGRLLRNPRLLITIDEYRPFFVEGQVGRPGAYPYQPGLNVRKAVTIGGGFKERASFDKIFVVREGDKSNSRVRVNLNSQVGAGDTVTVEESFF